MLPFLPSRGGHPHGLHNASLATKMINRNPKRERGILAYASGYDKDIPCQRNTIITRHAASFQQLWNFVSGCAKLIRSTWEECGYLGGGYGTIVVERKRGGRLAALELESPSARAIRAPLLQRFSSISLPAAVAEWAPNEKVALEVGLGVALAGGALVTMKHVGLNVAADPLFTAAYTGQAVRWWSSRPMIREWPPVRTSRTIAVLPWPRQCRCSSRPTPRSRTISRGWRGAIRAWRLPFILRTTTRVCHSKTVVSRQPPQRDASAAPFRARLTARVMIPGNARPAHRRLRQKLAELAQWNEERVPTSKSAARSRLGIITSGVSFYARPRGRPRGQPAEVGSHLSIAAGTDPAVRCFRPALPGRRGGRSISRRATTHRRHRRRWQGRDVSLW